MLERGKGEGRGRGLGRGLRWGMGESKKKKIKKNIMNTKSFKRTLKTYTTVKNNFVYYKFIE